jgi:hypothetical protein
MNKNSIFAYLYADGEYKKGRSFQPLADKEAEREA